MPWHISNNESGCNGYAVVKDDDGKVVGCHSTKEEAEDQLSALYASEAKKNVVSKPLWDGFFLPETD